MAIGFPGLGIQLHIHKIAFSILGWDIYWYAILIVVAMIISFIIFKFQDGKFGIHFQNIIDLSIYLIPISFASARIYYCLFSPEYFWKNPIQILNLRTGGLAIYGGIIGGIATCYFYCKSKKIRFLDLLDYLVPCLALGQSLGRWGNFLNNEAYGMETTLPWRMEIVENGILKQVHPTFLYESILTFGLFVFLIVMNKKRKFPGEITYWYLLVYSFARFWIEGLRTDSLMLFSVKVSQIVSILIFVFSCSMLSKNIVKEKRKNQNARK